MWALGAATAVHAASIVIFNNDPASVGFNDPAPVSPVGGNAGTTLGQQRLIAFRAAANKWGATLDSVVTVTIRSQWTALPCSDSAAVLGSAGAISIYRDFGGAPFASTWYNEALTGKLTTTDPDLANPEIDATFNVNLGNPGCLTGSFFYLGLDNNHGTNVDLVTVLTHEFAHGLGFQTFTDGATGTLNGGFASIYDRFLMDLGSGKSWLQMTDAERVASTQNTHKLAWNGPQVTADVPAVLALGTPVLKINSPASIAGRYDFGAASFGPAVTPTGTTGNIVLALDPNDSNGASTTDGCSALTNASAIAGNVALIDRGSCAFTSKALNAQNAGAIAVIIANNVAGSPPAGLGGADPAVIIPTVSITLGDGNAIKTQLGAGVNVTIKVDNAVRMGADPFGKALLFAPNPFQGGSSVSHWDTSAFPNQLMEPAINGDLTHEIAPPNDLTFSQMRDIGWVASILPSTIAKTSGDAQNASPGQSFATPIKVTTAPVAVGLAVTWTVNSSAAGGSAAFPSTNSRFAVTTTDASGVATAPTLTANGQSGPYFMNATVPGAGTTSFSLTNAPAPVAGPACITDTTTADFQAGIATNTDVTSSPNNVVLPSMALSGNFVSSVKDANAPASSITLWGTLAWTAVVPAATTLQFQVAASNNFGGPVNFVGPDGTSNTFFGNGASLAQFNGFRYLKSKAFFASVGTSTPTLNDTTVCYNNMWLPDLTLTKSHVGNFSLGQIGAKYTVVVTNSGSGDKPAASLVTLVDTPPSGLTITAISGAGWTCASLTTCTRSDALTSGASYPPVTVTVKVTAGTTSLQVNSASVTTAATESNTANNLATDSTMVVTGTSGSLTVSKFGGGGGTVASQDGGIACGATCTFSYVNGSNIALTATPAAGSVFTGWLGPCTGTGACSALISGATTVSATFALSPVTARILDIDANNAYDGATDGVLILRYLFGLTGSALTANALGAGFTPARVADTALRNYLIDILPLLDVDGNGKVDALTDGVMILRKLLGQTGAAITANAIGVGATRNTSDIEAYIQTLKPP